MIRLLATKYQKKPTYQVGCDGWINVDTKETGTWDKDGKAIRTSGETEKEKEDADDKRFN